MKACTGYLPIFTLISDGEGLELLEWLRRMFCGLRSRCTIPLDWRTDIADAGKTILGKVHNL